MARCAIYYILQSLVRADELLRQRAGGTVYLHSESPYCRQESATPSDRDRQNAVSVGAKTNASPFRVILFSRPKNIPVNHLRSLYA